MSENNLNQINLDEIEIDKEIILGHVYRFNCSIVGCELSLCSYKLKMKNRFYRLCFAKNGGGWVGKVEDEDKIEIEMKLNEREILSILRKNEKSNAELVCLKFLSRSVWKWLGEISID